MTSWKRPVAIILALTISVDILMWVSGMEPEIVLVATLGGLIGVGVWFVSDLLRVAVGSPGVPTGHSPPPAVSVDRRVTRLRSGIAFGRADGSSLEQLRQRLVDLTDDQLRSAREVDRTTDPGAARAILGERLSQFIEDPESARDLTSPDRLDHILTAIEKI